MNHQGAGSFIQQQPKKANKQPEDCYTPQQVMDLVTSVLGSIDVEVTSLTDISLGEGRVFLNLPESQISDGVAKLQAQIEQKLVCCAIAVLPASTHSNWLQQLLHTQPVCFFEGQMPYCETTLQKDYCFVYWGENVELFFQVFSKHGAMHLPVPDEFVDVVLSAIKFGFKVADKQVSTPQQCQSISDQTIETAVNREVGALKNEELDTVLTVKAETVSTHVGCKVIFDSSSLLATKYPNSWPVCRLV